LSLVKEINLTKEGSNLFGGQEKGYSNKKRGETIEISETGKRSV